MTSQTYNLDGPKEFPFPHPVRSADQLTVEIVPGAAVAPGDYEVVGVGPTSTQVTVRYPNAPTSGGLQLKITRYVAPERVTQIDSPSDINVTNLNAEFNTVYEAMTDLEASVLQQVQDMLDDFQTDVLDDFQTNVLDDFQTNVLDPAVATTLTARDEAVDARNAAQAAEMGAEGTLDDFRDLYWGAYATDPSTSPAGNPPDVGDLYFNTTASEWRVWNGSAWQQPDTKIPSVYDRRDYVASGDTEQTESYTSEEGQTFYAFPYDAPAVGVFVPAWGLLVEGVDYTYEQGVGVTLIPGANAVPDPVPEGVSVGLFGTIPETFPVNYDPPFVQVWVNGALLPPSDYEASSGTDVVPNEELPEGTEVTVIGILGASAAELGALVDLILATPNFVAYTDDIEGYVAAASDSADEAEGYAQDAQQAAVDTGEDRQATEAARDLAEGYRDEAQAAEGNAGDHAAAAQQFAADAEAAEGAAQGYAGDAQGYASTASGARDAAVGAYDDTVTERQAAQAAAGAAEGYRDQAQAAASAASDSADEAEGYAQEAQDALVAEPRILRAFGSLNRLFRDSSLWLDFKARSYVSVEANGDKYTRVYGDILTLSAPSPKWVWNAQGQLVEVPAGQPAYDHDPLTGEPLGQLLEYSSTNVLPRNTALDAWPNAGQEVVVTSGEIAPDGTPTAFKLAGIGGTLFRLIDPLGQATVIGDMYTTSFWCYGIADTSVPGNYRIYNPASGNTEFFNDQVVVGEWRFVEIASEATAENTAFQFRMIEGESYKIWLPQLEGGPTATSRIITEASAVTRAADVASLDGLQSADWFGDTMTWVMDLTPARIGNSTLLGNSPSRVFGMIGGTTRYGMFDGGNTTGPEASLIPVAGERRVIAAAYNPLTGEMKICAGGAVVKAPYNGSFGSLNSLSMFAGSAIGTLHSLRAKRSYATDAEMQELTS